MRERFHGTKLTPPQLGAARRIALAFDLPEYEILLYPIGDLNWSHDSSTWVRPVKPEPTVVKFDILFSSPWNEEDDDGARAYENYVAWRFPFGTTEPDHFETSHGEIPGLCVARRVGDKNHLQSEPWTVVNKREGLHAAKVLAHGLYLLGHPVYPLLENMGAGLSGHEKIELLLGFRERLTVAGFETESLRNRPF